MACHSRTDHLLGVHSSRSVCHADPHHLRSSHSDLSAPSPPSFHNGVNEFPKFPKANRREEGKYFTVHYTIQNQSSNQPTLNNIVFLNNKCIPVNQSSEIYIIQPPGYTEDFFPSIDHKKKNI